MPAPSAAFSPLTIARSASSRSRSAGRRSSTARRPGTPKTSARKRIFRSSASAGREDRGRAHLDGHVVAGVVRVARERLLLDGGEVGDAAELRRAADDVGADRERRVGDELRHRDDERRSVLRLDVDLASRSVLPVDDVRRDRRRPSRPPARRRRCRSARRRRAPTCRRRRAGTTSDEPPPPPKMPWNDALHEALVRPGARPAASESAPSPAEW